MKYKPCILAVNDEVFRLEIDKEIEELIAIKNSKKILQKDKTYINLKIKEISEDFKITYFEFLRIRLLYNQAIKNFESSKKEEKEIAKISYLNT